MDRVNLRGCDNYLSLPSVLLLLINSILHSKENFWIFRKLRRGRGLPDSVALLKTLCILSALLCFFSRCLFCIFVGAFTVRYLCLSICAWPFSQFWAIRQCEETIFLLHFNKSSFRDVLRENNRKFNENRNIVALFSTELLLFYKYFCEV